MKVDDDVFVNVFALMPRLHAIADTDVVANTSSSSSRMLLLCLIWRHKPVQRGGKWRVATTHYALETWPNYCAGPAYIMTVNFVEAALRLVPSVPLIPIEDVSYTQMQ